MAFVQQGAIQVTFSFRDQTGTRGSTRAHRPTTDTLAAVKTASDALATQLSASSGCQLLGYSVSASFNNDTVLAPAPQSRVERKGQLRFATAAGFQTELSVPGIVDAAVNPAGGLVSTAAPISALINEVLTGGWTDNRGVDLAAAVSDSETYRGTTRRGATSDTSVAS